MCVCVCVCYATGCFLNKTKSVDMNYDIEIGGFMLKMLKCCHEYYNYILMSEENIFLVHF